MAGWPDILHAFRREELVYVALLFCLFVLPRIVQRLGIPPAVTAMLLGITASVGPGWLVHDPTVELLSTLGIVALFLFAGMEVDTRQLVRDRAALIQHLVIRVALLAAAAAVCRWTLAMGWRPALVVALALLTPSTGFILDSIGIFGLNPQEERWVKIKAIATELLALVVLFFVIQSGSPARLGLSLAVILAMLALLPVVFRIFASHVLPYAPGSEFAFVIIVAAMCAMITRGLGVYYLLGAFVVGVVSRRFQSELPRVRSRDLLRAVELFASFFIPFYFFHAGTQIARDDLSVAAVLTGAAMLATGLPVRVLAVTLHRKIALHEPFRHAIRIATALTPTLVFTLVLAQILREQFHVTGEIYSGLVIYALVTTLLPGFVLRVPSPDFTSPRVRDDAPMEASPAEGAPADRK